MKNKQKLYRKELEITFPFPMHVRMTELSTRSLHQVKQGVKQMRLLAQDLGIEPFIDEYKKAVPQEPSGVFEKLYAMIGDEGEPRERRDTALLLAARVALARVDRSMV
jgi:hypothetical protein